MALFPTWLLARGLPLPIVYKKSDLDAARALERTRALRVDPANMDARQWLVDHDHESMQQWLGRKLMKGSDFLPGLDSPASRLLQHRHPL